MVVSSVDGVILFLFPFQVSAHTPSTSSAPIHVPSSPRNQRRLHPSCDIPQRTNPSAQHASLVEDPFCFGLPHRPRVCRERSYRSRAFDVSPSHKTSPQARRRTAFVRPTNQPNPLYIADSDILSWSLVVSRPWTLRLHMANPTTRSFF